MHCIPCMHCLICVSLGDVWGTVFYHALTFAVADLSILCCARSNLIFEVRGAKLTTCEDPYACDVVHAQVVNDYKMIQTRVSFRPLISRSMSSSLLKKCVATRMPWGFSVTITPRRES